MYIHRRHDEAAGEDSMTPTTHRHRPTHAISELAPAPYTGPVRWPGNPAAHGGVSYWQVCRCGATRRTNINGPAHEVGAWERE